MRLSLFPILPTLNPFSMSLTIHWYQSDDELTARRNLVKGIQTHSLNCLIAGPHFKPHELDKELNDLANLSARQNYVVGIASTSAPSFKVKEWLNVNATWMLHQDGVQPKKLTVAAPTSSTPVAKTSGGSKHKSKTNAPSKRVSA